MIALLHVFSFIFVEELMKWSDAIPECLLQAFQHFLRCPRILKTKVENVLKEERSQICQHLHQAPLAIFKLCSKHSLFHLTNGWQVARVDAAEEVRSKSQAVFVFEMV